MKRLFLLSASLLLALTAGAEPLRLAHVFSSHAVMQRETTAPVWGWGEPGRTVSVRTSWNGRTVKARVASDGTWRATVETSAAGGPYEITVRSGSDKTVLEDIWLGEVWVCSGQSNMEMPIGGFGFQEVEGATEAILGSWETASQVRVFDIRTPKCSEPAGDVDAEWRLSVPEVTRSTSAVAYFFARRLSASLGVPVGVIVNAWGGSRIEPWMTRAAIDAAGITAEERAEIDAVQEKDDHWPETPELIWNGRMLPVAGYAAKGFLWYQGCSNIGQRGCYDKLQASMVRLWRESWGRGDMPFLFALLAPYSHGDSDGRWRPHFVRTQMHTVELLPQSWYVCTETLGDEVTIHPPYKREVADMFVMRALQSVYGLNPGVSIDPPSPRDIVFGADGTVRITFNGVWSDLGSMRHRPVRGFELAGADREFRLADAEVDWDGSTVIVRCPSVSEPVAVRYAFRNFMGADLSTAAGIPVPPFRSDDWEY